MTEACYLIVLVLSRRTNCHVCLYWCTSSQKNNDFSSSQFRCLEIRLLHDLNLHCKEAILGVLAVFAGKSSFSNLDIFMLGFVHVFVHAFEDGHCWWDQNHLTFQVAHYFNPPSQHRLKFGIRYPLLWGKLWQTRYSIWMYLKSR